MLGDGIWTASIADRRFVGSVLDRGRGPWGTSVSRGGTCLGVDEGLAEGTTGSGRIDRLDAERRCGGIGGTGGISNDG